MPQRSFEQVETNDQWVVDESGRIVGARLSNNSAQIREFVSTTAGVPLNMVKLTQAQYNVLTPDANTLYVIVG
jgi:hypothetical protein